MKILFALLLASNVFAGTTIFDGEKITYDDEFSLKQVGCPDWSKRKDLDDKVMYAITFSCTEPNTRVFPDDMAGVWFYNANIDNVYIPPNNAVVNFNHPEPIQYKAQNDGEDWKLTFDGDPLEPIAKEKYEELGLSTDPNDIPQQKLAEPITWTTEKQKEAEVKPVKP